LVTIFRRNNFFSLIIFPVLSCFNKLLKEAKKYYFK